MNRRTFLGTPLAIGAGSPLPSAQSRGRWDDAAGVLECITPDPVTGPFYLFASAAANRLFFRAHDGTANVTFSYDGAAALTNHGVTMGTQTLEHGGAVYFFGAGVWTYDATGQRLVRITDRSAELLGVAGDTAVLAMDDPVQNTQIYRLALPPQ